MEVLWCRKKTARQSKLSFIASHNIIAARRTIHNALHNFSDLVTSCSLQHSRFLCHQATLLSTNGSWALRDDRMVNHITPPYTGGDHVEKILPERGTGKFIQFASIVWVGCKLFGLWIWQISFDNWTRFKQYGRHIPQTGPKDSPGLERYGEQATNR